MPVRIEANAEPIPGYRLIERLGGGGFGEVWKAEAPGGLHKAIKFVFGDLQATDDADGARATQELKALSRVKTVHHPYILSLERYDIIDGQLIIVMELADRTLWDRFRECRNQGLPGIPRAELLPYMRDTAEALDLMNIQFQLQHLDIKPQNLFLVFNHVKVADFGLVKDLGNMAAATVTGGVTPVYAAPETFDGWLSRFSDQYSLAIVYQELLTGQRPFAGSTMRQLVLQHLQEEPNVSCMPARERAVMQRALAKNPEDRFPTCLEFVQAIDAAATPKANLVPEAPQHTQSLTETTVDAPTPPAEHDDEGSHARGNDKQRPEPPSGHSRLNVLPPRPMGLAPEPTPRPRAPKSGTSAADDAHITPMPAVTPASADDSAHRGVVQPALVVGLGKLGVQTLLALRRALNKQFGEPDAQPHIRFVGIDTDPEMIKAAGQGDSLSALRPHELVLARLHRPAHYLQRRTRAGELPTDSWLNSKLIYQLPKRRKTAGLRALGRLAFVDNYRHIAHRLETELQACIAAEAPPEPNGPASLGIRSAVPRVYVVAGLAGNTGGGMFIDAAYALRGLLRRLGYGHAEVVGLFFLPAMPHDAARSTTLAQTYAALTELQHYASGQSPFSALYPGSDAAPSKPISETGPPFDRCLLLTMPSAAGSAESAGLPDSASLAGQFLCGDLATTIGKTLDALRQQRRLSVAPRLGPAPIYQTFGLYHVVWPRQRVLEQTARRFSQRLVAHWMAKDATALVETVATWSQEQWDELGLRPEALIARHQELIEQKLKNAPERMLQAILTPLVPVLAPANDGKGEAGAISVAPVVSAMSSLEKLIGIPDDCRSSSQANLPPGAIEKALVDVSVSLTDSLDRQLTALVVRLLEEPVFRLAGAEECLRQFCRIAELALQAQETLTKELNDRAVLLYQRMQTLLESPQPVNIAQSNTIWKFGLARKPASGGANFGPTLLELLRVYAKTRYQCLILRHINRLYVSLRGQLSDQIREVGFCRQRLTELSGLLEPKSTADLSPMAAFEKLLLPPECHTIADVVERLNERLSQDDVVAFDKVMQPIIHDQYRALLTVCMGPSNLVRTLAPIMVHEAEAFLGKLVQDEARTELEIADPQDAADAETLRGAFELAAPSRGKISEPAEIAVAAFPATPSGRLFKDLARTALPGVQLIDSRDGDDITFYRETQQISLQDLQQYGSVAQEAYRSCCAVDPVSLHSRTDVPGWQSAAS